jgi:hypothetical protein
MKLEHRREQVANPSRFALRLFRYSLWSAVLILFSLLLGVVGYHYIAQLDWLTSIHMASMILTGMGPVTDIISAEGIWFSSFYALYSGIAFLSTSAVFLTPVIHRVLHVLHVEAPGSRDKD